jgi:hypothetical protein
MRRRITGQDHLDLLTGGIMAMSRITGSNTFPLLFALAVWLAPSVYAADPAALVKQMPRAYTGQFQGRDSARISRVTINFTDVRVIDKGQVEARGTGVYDINGDIINVSVRAIINPVDHYFEMWEYESGAGAEESEGIYRGDLSPDMRSITALWTTFADRKRGSLNLTANP